MHQCKTNLHAIAAVAVIPRHAGYNPPNFLIGSVPACA